jgi:hypothetical protein
MLAYNAPEFWIQLYNFVSWEKILGNVLPRCWRCDITLFTLPLKSCYLLVTPMFGLPFLISGLPIHHLEPNMNEKICFTMFTLLLSFCKWYFSRVCDKILVYYSFIKLYFLSFIHSFLAMPYSNPRRHNSPSIPQTPYQTLIIPCPNFDPIYQMILLENSNEWNLSPAKEGSY